MFKILPVVQCSRNFGIGMIVGAALEHFHADWKSRSDIRPMKLLAKFELERFQSA
jgi:hypothetical protein